MSACNLDIQKPEVGERGLEVQGQPKLCDKLLQQNKTKTPHNYKAMSKNKNSRVCLSVSGLLPTYCCHDWAFKVIHPITRRYSVKTPMKNKQDNLVNKWTKVSDTHFPQRTCANRQEYVSVSSLLSLRQNANPGYTKVHLWFFFTVNVTGFGVR